MTPVLFVFYIFLQITDGLFTFHGIKTAGLVYEGNPLMLYMMLWFGFFETLIATKFTAIFLGYILYKFKADILFQTSI